MRNNLGINFHQTFKPEVQYISAILKIADMSSYMSIKDISSITGIPNGESSGKVEPHIIYSYYMGLIDYEKDEGKYKINRTKLGSIIFVEDPGLQEKLSLMLCHCSITNEQYGADVWQGSFNFVFPKYRNLINKDLFIKELSFIYGDKINKKNVSPFLNSYDDFFYPLNLLSSDDNEIVFKKHMYNSEYIYLYAYFLFDRWDLFYSDCDEISSVDLTKLHFGTPFNWNDADIYKALEHISEKGLIRLNRQLMPYTILRQSSKDLLLSKLYSELI